MHLCEIQKSKIREDVFPLEKTPHCLGSAFPRFVHSLGLIKSRLERDKENVVAMGETCSRLGEMRDESGPGFREGNPKSLPLLSPEPEVERRVLETPSRMSHTGSSSPPSRDICGFCPPSPQLWQMLTVPSWWDHCLAPRSLRDLMPPTPDFSLLCE